MTALLLVLGALLLVLGGILFSACRDHSVVVQPIQFNHKAHTEKGLSCSFCHQFVDRAAFAGIPRGEFCMTCHQGAITESPEEEKIREYAAKGMEIPWQRIYEAPGHVFFSHRRHVALGGIECAECHGPVGESTAPLKRPAVTIAMDTCMDCHAQRQVSNDCNACHH
jgi:hypothetical protein